MSSPAFKPHTRDVEEPIGPFGGHLLGGAELAPMVGELLDGGDLVRSVRG